MISEAEFMPVVRADLEDRFGADNVLREPVLPSGRVPDFIATGPLSSWTVEVENQTDDLADGVGQAIMYAQEYGDDNEAQPAVYIPSPTDNFTELRNARKAVRVVTLDPAEST